VDFAGRRRRLTALAPAVVSAVLCATVAGCADEEPPTSEPTAAASEPTGGSSLAVPPHAVLLLAPSSTSPTAPVQLGTADLDVSVSSLSGGGVGTAANAAASDKAFSFPRFHGRNPYPRAVLIARNRGSVDMLSPKNDNFAYGADIRLDSKSTGRPEDNGNNIIQRGLSSDPVMFKVDVDANLRPECTVKGRAGSVTVYAKDPIQPDQWYRVQCRKRANRVWIFVAEFLPSGSTSAVAKVTEGRTGPVTLVNPDTPVSVGGKVAVDGTVINSASDQFNGRIANPFVRIQTPQ